MNSADSSTTSRMSRRPLLTPLGCVFAACLSVGSGCASDYDVAPAHVVVPDDATCWQFLAAGRASIEASDFDRAIKVLESARSRFPGCKEVHAALGHALVGKQRYRDAIEAYSKAIGIDGDYEGAYVGRGWTRWFIGDLEAAADDYRKVIQLDPEDVLYYKELERVLFDLGRPMEVAELWAAAYRRFPTWTNAKYWRVVALERAERWDLLRVELPGVLAMEGFGGFAHLHYLLGRALDDSGEYRPAASSLRHAVDLAWKADDKDVASLQLYGDELIFSLLWAGDRARADRCKEEMATKLAEAARHASGS